MYKPTKLNPMTRARTYSLLTIVFSFGLLLLGAMVHHSSNSIVCTSWPLCYGLVQPLEFGLNKGHRILGLIVGLLTLFLVFRVKKEEGANRELSGLAFFALFLVGLQGLLGGVTSLYRLPTIVNTSHFALSVCFFSTLILLDHKLVRGEGKTSLEMRTDTWGGLHLSDGLGLLVFLSFLTILLGAFVRHSGALNACGVGWDSILSCSTDNNHPFWPTSKSGQIHMFYRYFSFVTWAFGGLWLWRVFNHSLGLRKIAVFTALALSSHQIFGLVAVGSGLSQPWTLIHFASGVLALSLFWKMNLQVREIEKEKLGADRYSFWSDLLDLTKPRLGLLVMATVFVGMMLAPRPITFFKGLTGFTFTFLLVMGAAAFNCWMEKDIDALMDRTKDRPLPAGRMEPMVAFVFSSVLMIGSIAALAYFINATTAVLGAISAVLYVFAYTPLKQKSVVALYVGAIPGALPPLMGWTIVMGKMTALSWCLFAILFVWQLPHFLAISIYHAEDYGKAKIKVYPNSFGLTLTKWGIFLLTGLLAYASLYAWWYDLGVTDLFGYFALILNVIFMGVATKVLLIPTVNKNLLKRWARIYFFGSIFYLPLLLGSMIYLS